MIILDILGWPFNGLPGQTNYFLNQDANLALYIFKPVPPMVWILYTNYQVHFAISLSFTLSSACCTTAAT